ncbi:hypothetical protein [uncultured Pseudokineococcus sp.]|uniref:hypothetical protein n=1 Tax=uncultured Pseudokineococcus sp. TaxID=1642928 RepID=UPI002619FA44|nr:hypothetical protein [uncultured Pseudokineococcus sp.]
MRGPHEWGGLARLLPAWAGLVLASALAWWLLAPQPQVVTDGTQRVSPGLPELAAAQDGVFVLVTAVAGLVAGAAALRARRGPSGPAAVVALVAAAAGALATSWLGRALGGLVAGPRRGPALPDDVASRLADGVQVAPAGLQLQATVALAVAPTAAALLVTVVLIAGMLRAPARREPYPADSGDAAPADAAPGDAAQRDDGRATSA